MYTITQVHEMVEILDSMIRAPEILETNESWHSRRIVYSDWLADCHVAGLINVEEWIELANHPNMITCLLADRRRKEYLNNPNPTF